MLTFFCFMEVLTHASLNYQPTHFAGTSSRGNEWAGLHDPFTEKYKRGIGIREGWERYCTGHQNISMGPFFSSLF
jgi:hypothetical protein